MNNKNMTIIEIWVTCGFQLYKCSFWTDYSNYNIQYCFKYVLNTINKYCKRNRMSLTLRDVCLFIINANNLISLYESRLVVNIDSCVKLQCRHSVSSTSLSWKLKTFYLFEKKNGENISPFLTGNWCNCRINNRANDRAYTSALWVWQWDREAAHKSRSVDKAARLLGADTARIHDQTQRQQIVCIYRDSI